MTDAYAQPQEVDDVLLAFPARLGELLPPSEVIPADYPHRHEWLRFQSMWFAGTLPADCQLEALEGVDAAVAGRHLEAIQQSFEPKHEHKADAVAWLASRWFLRASTPDSSYSCPEVSPRASR
ncbi:hypothetical protein [Mycobacterium timonense]|uniref:Uncharacterized protein n=1 Tax=Mycobacterium timonense TaxID=701043 RepID=A0ABX3TF88_9MYCO|nr:hypothetical protein [Mycobacterium timonense]ORB77461.1 hypothetical protein BST46_24395 [Mycobacterium timonense]